MRFSQALMANQRLADNVQRLSDLVGTTLGQIVTKQQLWFGFKFCKLSRHSFFGICLGYTLVGVHMLDNQVGQRADHLAVGIFACRGLELKGFFHQTAAFIHGLVGNSLNTQCLSLILAIDPGITAFAGCRHFGLAVFAGINVGIHQITINGCDRK